MFDLLQRAQKAKAIVDDQTILSWRRATQALQSFSGLELTGIPSDVRAELETDFVSINQILARYPLKSAEDYEHIRDADLRRILETN